EPGVIGRVAGNRKRKEEKINLGLKDKVRESQAGLEALAAVADVDAEVIEALIALGYSVVEAQRAVQRLPKEATGVEERLRLALSQFSA
ncbi:hypothetical protein RY27_10955, partial [Litorilinea aerophila]